MIVTVKGIEEKTKGDNKWITVTDENGKTHNIFSHLKDKWALCFEGATVELVKKKNEVNPKYWDVVDIKSATVKEAVQADQSATYATKATERASIQRQVAVKAVVECLCNKVEVPHTLVGQTWAVMAEWLGITPPEATESPAEGITSTEGITEAQKKKLGVIAREKGLKSEGLRAYMMMAFGKEHSKDLSMKEATEFITAIESGAIEVS